MVKRACVACLSVLFACSSEREGSEPVEREYEGSIEEIIENLREAGYPDTEIDVRDGIVFAGGDAVVNLEASREMIGVQTRGPNGQRFDPTEADDFRQYRTTNQMSSDVEVICIDGRDFSGTLSTSLNNAIVSYNDLNLSFEMIRTTGSNTGCDAEIIADAVSGSGGSAGFPSGGLPFNEINIGRGVARLGVAVTSHVIIHELGHCIGFRHTDFFNRSISCGVGGNEGAGPDGAIHIPGTPTGAVLDGSVMNSCFSDTSTGVFTDTDLIALDVLYGDGGGDDSDGGDGGDPDPSSCVETSSCGGPAPAGCFCDSACVFFGDCCPDGPC